MAQLLMVLIEDDGTEHRLGGCNLSEDGTYYTDAHLVKVNGRWAVYGGQSISPRLKDGGTTAPDTQDK